MRAVRPTRFAALFTFALALLSCTGPGRAVHEGFGKERRISLLATADTWGELEPCG